MTNKEIKTILNEIITPEVRRRADQIEKAIINDKGKQIFNRKGAGSGKYIRATAINQAKREIEKQKEQSIQEPETPEQTPETMDENKVRQMVRDVLSKPLIKKVSENHEERSENDRYMFFSNLEQMRRQCDILLDLDRGMIERILDNGHDWAQDHITEAKSFLDQVFDFLMNETKKPSMDIEDGNMVDEKLKPSMGVETYVKDFEKSKAPQFDKKSKKKKSQMAVAAFLSAEDKNKIKEAITKKLYEDTNKIKKLEADLAKIKHQYYSVPDLPPEKETELRKQMGDIGRELKRTRREDKTGSSGYGKPSSTQKIKEAILAKLKNK